MKKRNVSSKVDKIALRMKNKGVGVKAFLILFVMLCSGISFGQQVDKGKVVATFQYGDEHIAIIQNDVDGFYYKSSPYTDDVLSELQIVDLQHGDNPLLQKVIASGLTETLYAMKINVPTGDGTPSAELLYSLPTLENDILFFSNQDHLFDVYELMDQYLAEGGDEGLPMEDKLNLIEDQFPGFKSYRLHFERTFLPNDTDLTIEDIEFAANLEFVNYEVLKTFLNDSRMIGIGNKIYYYHGKDLILEFDKNNMDAIAFAQDAATDLGNNEAPSLENDTRFIGLIVRGHVLLLSNVMDVVSHSKGSINDPGTGYGYQTVAGIFHAPDFCNPMVKGLKFTLSEYQALGTDVYYEDYPLGGSTVFIVDWGDGSVITYNGYDSETLYHTYTSESYFDVKTTLHFIDRWGDPQVIHDGTGAGVYNPAPIIIPFHTQVNCSDADAFKNQSATSGNWLMQTKIWVNHNMLGTHVGSYTHSYKKNNNGQWDRKSAKIHTSVEGTFRDDNCNVVEYKTGDKTHNNDKRIEISKSKVFQRHRRLYQYDVKSHHYLQKDGVTITLDLTLIDC